MIVSMAESGVLITAEVTSDVDGYSDGLDHPHSVTLCSFASNPFSSGLRANFSRRSELLKVAKMTSDTARLIAAPKKSSRRMT